MSEIDAKDTFGRKLAVGDPVIYATGGGAGTSYSMGRVSKLHPCVHYSPERVSVNVTQSTVSGGREFKPEKDPIVYSSNVVRIPLPEVAELKVGK